MTLNLFKQTAWLIFCILPVFFTTFLYGLLISGYKNIELLAGFLAKIGLNIDMIGLTFFLILPYLFINLLQLLLVLFLLFANQTKFNKLKFRILFLSTAVIFALGLIWIIPHFSVIQDNFLTAEFLFKRWGSWFKILDIIFPLSQLFFLYICWTFWQLWFKEKPEIATENEQF